MLRIRDVTNSGADVVIRYTVATAKPTLREETQELRMPKAEAWRLMRMLVEAHDYEGRPQVPRD